MSNVPSSAAIQLLRRESPTLVAAMGLIFCKLGQMSPAMPVSELLESTRTGVWGDPSLDGVGWPVLRSTNLRGAYVDITEPAWCDIEASKAEGAMLRGGDILVTKSSGSSDLVGKAAIFEHDQSDRTFLFSNFLLRLRPNRAKVDPRYLAWFLRSPQSLEWRSDTQLNAVGLRNLQTKPYLLQRIPLPNLQTQSVVADHFAALERADGTASLVQLPPLLLEQRRIVARIEALAAKIAEARATMLGVESDCAAMFGSLFRQLAEGAPRRALAEVAPLTRRPAAIDPAATYPQVSVRSFGRGSFHSGVLDGSAISWEKPHLVLAGDILVSNIKAWEGAIAVAGPEDHGRYGSHRYLTFQPVKGVAVAEWLCHYLLSPEGLYYVGEASPGSADRNRTTSAKAMCAIGVPLPSAEKQAVFAEAKAKTATLKQLQQQSVAELDALLPSILDRAFQGRL